ncbi:MAG: tryptophan--tRNA ligase [Planctomycetota bacterium]
MRRLCSGVRPHGPLHLGHWAGLIQEWLACQEEYECFFLIADVQALVAHAGEPEMLAVSVREVALDWLAAGIDPNRCHIIVQSRTPELAELTVYLQMLVRTGELRRNTTMREEARALGQRNLYERMNDIHFGFLGYPVAQVADILLFTTTPAGDADRLVVSAGEDQLPHVELARTIARRFNETYSRVFLEPEARIAPLAELPGTDGGYKMGTTGRNAILLTESEEEYGPKIQSMFTDPMRLKRTDPGHPDSCACFAFFAALGEDPGETEERGTSCRLAEADCRQCKADLVAAVGRVLGPFQERRAEFAKDPALVEEALAEGTRRARKVAGQTMERVRDAMHLA